MVTFLDFFFWKECLKDVINMNLTLQHLFPGINGLNTPPPRPPPSVLQPFPTIETHILVRLMKRQIQLTFNE